MHAKNQDLQWPASPTSLDTSRQNGWAGREFQEEVGLGTTVISKYEAGSVLNYSSQSSLITRDQGGGCYRGEMRRGELITAATAGRHRRIRATGLVVMN